MIRIFFTRLANARRFAIQLNSIEAQICLVALALMFTAGDVMAHDVSGQLHQLEGTCGSGHSVGLSIHFSKNGLAAKPELTKSFSCGVLAYEDRRRSGAKLPTAWIALRQPRALTATTYLNGLPIEKKLATAKGRRDNRAMFSVRETGRPREGLCEELRY